MKIGVMSDSHDNLTMIRRALERFEAEGAECLIHAGDFVAPFAVQEILKFKSAAYGCFGNNDGEKAGIRKLWPGIADPPCELALGGRRILLTHDEASLAAHSTLLRAAVSDVERAGAPEMLRRAEVVILGHTHRPSVRPGAGGGPLRINPGECCGWLSGKGTVAILDTATPSARIVEL